MKKLSETYKERESESSFPIESEDKKVNVTYFQDSYGVWHRYKYDEQGNLTYYEDSDGFWSRSEYDEHGKITYHEDSSGFWSRSEYDEHGKITYHEDSSGYKRGSCAGKVIEVDGKKYKLQEL